MNKKRIDAKTIRLQAEAARAEAETKSAEELKIYKRKQKAAVEIAKQLLTAACNGKKCAPLDPNSYLDHIDLLTSNGYSIVGVGYVRREYLDLQMVALTHRAALAKAINDSQELQDFLWANQWTKTAVETNMGILLKLLNSTHTAWSKDGCPRSRVYFTNFLWGKNHYKNGVGSTPNRGLFETLESVWCEYLLYESATSNAKLLNADLKAIGTKAVLFNALVDVPHPKWNELAKSSNIPTQSLMNRSFDAIAQVRRRHHLHIRPKAQQVPR
jgi:hypothetical protein